MQDALSSGGNASQPDVYLGSQSNIGQAGAADHRRALLDWVYGDLTQPGAVERVHSRTIRTPNSWDVDELNATATELFPGEAREFLSADGPLDIQVEWPIEFLNSLTLSGIPPHRLTLKVGMPVMLMLNMDPSGGLANGTRLIIRRMGRTVLEVEVAGGAHAGTRCLLPRIDMSPSEHTLPFPLTRRQFPVRPAFAITTNKAQGQLLERVGAYLPCSVYSYGQLYVAASRVGASGRIIKFLVKGGRVEGLQGGYTTNVVFNHLVQ